MVQACIIFQVLVSVIIMRYLYEKFAKKAANLILIGMIKKFQIPQANFKSDII